MEQRLVNGNQKLREIVVIGFLEILKILHRGNPSAERYLFLSSGRSLTTPGMRLKECGREKAA
jgi:hypothetical protein